MLIVDHAPAVGQVRDRGLRGREHRAHVDRKGAVEVLDGQLIDRAGREDAGAVDQDVQSTEPARSLIDAGAQGNGVGAVDARCERAAAVGLDLVRQPPHDGSADAARAAGDESGLAGQGSGEVGRHVTS